MFGKPTRTIASGIAMAAMLATTGCSRGDRRPPERLPIPEPEVEPLPPPPPPSVEIGRIYVEGVGASQFHYIEQHLFYSRPGATNDAKVGSILRGNDFGPWAANQWVNVRVGDTYYFFPICPGGTRFHMGKSGQVMSLTERRGVKLTCPR